LLILIDSIRIRIHKIIKSGSNPDPDSQPWFKIIITNYRSTVNPEYFLFSDVQLVSEAAEAAATVEQPDARQTRASSQKYCHQPSQ
jgi:hypothetical protein